MTEICVGGRGPASVDLTYERRYPCTVNDPECTRAPARVAAQVVGDGRVDPDCDGIPGRRGLRLLPTADPRGVRVHWERSVTEQSGPVHNPAYDFNDDIIEPGARFLAAIAMRRWRTSSRDEMMLAISWSSPGSLLSVV